MRFKTISIVGILFVTVAILVYAENSNPPKDGEKLFEKLNCYECHTIAGIGYAVGPILDGLVKEKIKKAGEVKYKEWLKGFLSDPPKAKPGTQKPMLKKIPTDEEYEKIFEFLKSL